MKTINFCVTYLGSMEVPEDAPPDVIKWLICEQIGNWHPTDIEWEEEDNA